MAILAVGIIAERQIELDAHADIVASLKARAAIIEEFAGPAFAGGRTSALETSIRLLGSNSGIRITLIEPSGRILADSEENPGGMENHANRPEIVQAQREGEGMDTRHSRTLLVDMTYYARRVARGKRTVGFVRTALPLTAIREKVERLRTTLVLAGLIGLAASLLIGLVLARQVARPLASMADAAEAVAHGRELGEVRAEGPGELADLGRSFNRMTASLRQLERVRKDFVANVSHELKTPVSAIRMLVETLIEDEKMDPAEHRRFLERTRIQTLRMSTLIDDLLTLSRVESAGTPIERYTIDLRAPVREAVEPFISTARSRGLELSVALPHEAIEVAGDAESLRQATGNLVDNAVKYTQSGGKVAIALSREAREAVFSVADTGPGIAPEHLDRIFERFYRVDKARSRELGGTGLGLAIVRHIVIAHGGRVTVESVPGRGSTFRLYIPL